MPAAISRRFATTRPAMTCQSLGDDCLLHPIAQLFTLTNRYFCGKRVVAMFADEGSRLIQ